MTTPPPEHAWIEAARARGLTSALGIALVSVEGFILPLALVVLLLGVALAGAARLVRRQ